MSDLHIPGHIDEKSMSKHNLIRSIALHRGELSEYACAECLYTLYKDEFIYYEGWYQCKRQKWVRMKDCVELRRYIPSMKVFMDEENKKLRSEQTILENVIRDEEDSDEKNEEHIKKIKTNIEALETRRLNIIRAREQLDKTAFKNNIITECRDLFLDTKGIIAVSNEEEKLEYNMNTPGFKKEIMNESHIKSFIFFLVMKDIDYIQDEIILIKTSDLLIKFNNFMKNNNIIYNINTISFGKLLKNLNIDGIRTGINTKTCKKTEFIKKDIKKYLGY